MSVLMSQRQFAKLIGRSVGYVNKKVKEGVINLHGPKNKIDPQEAKEALKNNADPARDAQREANEKRRGGTSIFSECMLPKASIADLSDEEREEYSRRMAEEKKKLENLKREAENIGANIAEMPNDLPSSTSEANIYKLYYEAKLKEIEFKKKTGELFEREDVQRQATEVAFRVDNSFSNLATRLTVSLGLSKEQQHILRAEIDAAKLELSIE